VLPVRGGSFPSCNSLSEEASPGFCPPDGVLVFLRRRKDALILTNLAKPVPLIRRLFLFRPVSFSPPRFHRLQSAFCQNPNRSSSHLSLEEFFEAFARRTVLLAHRRRPSLNHSAAVSLARSQSGDFSTSCYLLHLSVMTVTLNDSWREDDTHSELSGVKKDPMRQQAPPTPLLQSCRLYSR